MKRHLEYYNRSLSRHIEKYIKKKGPISFKMFFHEALYSKNLGYYSSSRKKIGNFNDFSTAPGISSFFGKAIAIQCLETLKSIGKEGVILEFGAGCGLMAIDILLFLEAKKSLPKFYYIVEISEYMREIQFKSFKEKIPHILPNIIWISSVPKKRFQGIVLANELMDAMPVHKFRFCNNKLQEAYVNFVDNKFVFNWGAPSSQLINYIQSTGIHSDNDYESEINLCKKIWLNSIAKSLHRGLILIIDYGFNNRDYYGPQRFLGNIVCYRRQKAYYDPLQYVGYQDITAHVNFTNLAKEGIEKGFYLVNYTSQRNFLINSTTKNLLKNFFGDIFCTTRLKQLVLPGMGDIFKVITFKKH